MIGALQGIVLDNDAMLDCLVGTLMANDEAQCTAAARVMLAASPNLPDSVAALLAEVRRGASRGSAPAPARLTRSGSRSCWSDWWSGAPAHRCHCACMPWG